MSESNPQLVDPIDALVPPPAPWWRRLIVGTLIVAVVGIGAFLWGFGYLRPQPDCCGGGSASTMMSLSTDGRAVTTTAYVFNSSGRDLVVSEATAVLPGAEVLAVAALHPDNNHYPTDDVIPFPASIGSHDDALFLITFRPTTCTDDVDGEAWGTLSLELDVANSWIPSLGRTYERDVLESSQDLSVLPPAWVIDPPQQPLGAACAHLGL